MTCATGARARDRRGRRRCSPRRARREARPMTVLTVQGISKFFGGMRAVDEVGFSVSAGELLALIGPNGAGKTTCFNMLNGQLRPDRGRIRLGGMDITGLAPRRVWRLGVGRTFQ